MDILPLLKDIYFEQGCLRDEEMHPDVVKKLMTSVTRAGTIQNDVVSIHNDVANNNPTNITCEY